MQEITDRLEIDDLLTRYTRAIDTGEWDRLDKVFTPDAEIDYTATGGIAASYPEVKPWLAEMLRDLPAPAAHARPGRQRRGRGQRRRGGVLPQPDDPPVQDGSETVVEFGGVYHELVRTTEAGARDGCSKNSSGKRM